MSNPRLRVALVAAVLALAACGGGCAATVIPTQASILRPGEVATTPCDKALITLNETDFDTPAYEPALRALGQACSAAEWAAANLKLADKYWAPSDWVRTACQGADIRPLVPLQGSRLCASQ